MGKPINVGTTEKVMAYDALSQKIFAIAQTENHLMGDFIPNEVGTYWRIGQVLAWHAEDLMETLAFELRNRHGKAWQVRDLAKMVQLYLYYPTVERLSDRCIGRRQGMSIDEFLNVK